jgi:hypothetical protein
MMENKAGMCRWHLLCAPSSFPVQPHPATTPPRGSVAALLACAEQSGHRPITVYSSRR